jgi:hypothetical protein
VTGPDGKTWLAPGKIQLSNVSPGKSITQSLTIHNGGDVTTTFSVYYRTPDYVADNFVTAPEDSQEWISIGETSPVLAPQETKEIQVILEIPEDSETPKRWEFWIGVKAQGENALTAEFCSRWLVAMRGK